MKNLDLSFFLYLRIFPILAIYALAMENLLYFDHLIHDYDCFFNRLSHMIDFDHFSFYLTP